MHGNYEKGIMGHIIMLEEALWHDRSQLRHRSMYCVYIDVMVNIQHQNICPSRMSKLFPASVLMTPRAPVSKVVRVPVASGSRD